MLYTRMYPSLLGHYRLYSVKLSELMDVTKNQKICNKWWVDVVSVVWMDGWMNLGVWERRSDEQPISMRHRPR